MQENLKKNKRDNALKIFVSFVIVLVFCASLVLAICAPVFSSNGVASAIDVTLPTDGIVGDNLVPQSSNFTSLSSDWVSNTSLPSFSGGNLKFTNNLSSIQYPYQKLGFTPKVGDVFTISIYVVDIVKPVYVWFRNVKTTLVSGVNNLSVGLNTITYSISQTGLIQLAFSLPSSSMIEISWMKVERGSSFTGYVPNYQNQINSLQNEVNQLNNDKQELQDNYDSLSNRLQYSVLSSLSLSNTLVYRSSTQQNLFSDALQISVNNVSYPGYYFYFDGGTNHNSSRDYLFKFRLDSTIPSGDEIKFYVDFVTFWDGVGVVPGSNYYLGVYYSYSDFSSSNRENNSGWIYYPLSDLNKFYSDSRFFSFDVNAVYFDLFQLDQGAYVSVPLQSSVTNKDGLFLSNFSLLMRPNSVGSVVDSARQEGYNNGYNVGKQAGYNEGYSYAVNTLGDYTFTGLLGAVFDVPIQAFKGLLSFEVLGVDMSAFVSSLFALAIIVVIIKIALGGK